MIEKTNALLIAAALVGDKEEAIFAKNISRYWRSKGVKVAPKDVAAALKRVDYEDILGTTTIQEMARILISPENKKRLGRFTA